MYLNKCPVVFSDEAVSKFQNILGKKENRQPSILVVPQDMGSSLYYGKSVGCHFLK